MNSTIDLERIAPPSENDLYTYKARPVRVVDGDTVILDIDLGCGMWLRGERCRLLGINAPEPHTDTRHEGLRSTQHLKELLCMDIAVKMYPVEILVRTHKDKKGKWGRWLVELWTQDDLGEYAVCVNQQMIDDGYAEPYEI